MVNHPENNYKLIMICINDKNNYYLYVTSCNKFDEIKYQ